LLSFEDEISKFKPVLETEQIERVVGGGEIQDLADAIRILARNISGNASSAE
jgi:hypothetical protein